MPSDTIPVGIAIASQGWRVCHYQSLKEDPPEPLPINQLVQFVKSQPEYIS